MSKILLIEDDPTIADLVNELLSSEGHLVCWCETGGLGLAKLETEQPDLIVLDVRLPDIDGLKVCEEIRKTSRLPILMLSARSEDVDKIAGMEVGADDYLAKPFNPKELLARVKAQLRRWTQWQESTRAVPPAPRDEAVVTRQASVLFADIWNYGALSGTRPLDEFADQVEEFYEKVERIVNDRQGVLNNNWGESIVAIFAEVALAARAAQQIQQDVGLLNQQWVSNGRLPFGVGIGIHTGEVLMGDVSLRGKAEFALVGKQAKRAASIEKLTRSLNAKILVSQSTAVALGDGVSLKSRGMVSLEIDDEPEELFELALGSLH